MTTKEAVEHFGGIRELAYQLRIWPHNISRWGERPPMRRQYQLQLMTKGKLRADDDAAATKASRSSAPRAKAAKQ